ncbi:hypothetical protein GCM10010174_77210 [Kutzneria viridogrisea]|uniref:Glycopeptide antibiotics resistance protein n=1 Tax=Kutzneria viridogrisea TaxID=47990 RepID=A0ABR6BPM0_9PSEU|nr:glycopeptide antibiotics resistance protein [Kutzneria viridogrisea]
MSSAYLLPIKTAVFVFPLLALFLLVPVAIVLYRRHGIMSSWRTLSFYSFLFYALTAFCMTIVPLPGPSVDVCAKYPELAHPQLTLGNTFNDIWKEAKGEVSLNALVLHNPAVIETGLNLLLLLPLGVYLRYHFRRGFLASSLIGFGTAAFFELTQLTGVWGLYECPYRLFDVDDLAVNTAGAMLGWAVAGPLTRWLPTLDTLDDAALARRPVPVGRRLLALLLDFTGLPFLMGFLSLVCAVLLGKNWFLFGPVLAVAVWFVLLPWWTGATPGKWVLLLRLVGPDGGRPAPWRLAVRVLVLSVPFLPIPIGLGVVLAAAISISYAAAGGLLDRIADNPGVLLELVGEHLPSVLAVLALLGVTFGLFVAFAVALLWHPRRLGLHELISGVHNVALPHKRARRPEATPEPATEPVAVAD